MGLGKFLRGALGVASFVPGPWAVPARIASAGLGLRDAIKKSKGSPSSPKSINEFAIGEGDRSRGLYEGYRNDLTSRLGTARQHGEDLYNRVTGGYQGILDDPNAFGRSGYSDFASTGGWSPEQRASLGRSISGLRDIGETGGIGPAEQFRARGGGVYDEFARTGGFSDTDKANFRSRATSTIPSFYDTLGTDLERTNRVQGNFNPGFTSQMAKLAREKAFGANDAALGAETSLSEAIRQGRMAGAGGMASSEMNLQGLLTGNRLRGLTGAGDLEMNMNEAINRNRLAGLGGFANADRSRADILGNLQTLRTQVPGEEALFEQLYGRAIEGDVDAQRSLLALRMGYNPNKSWAERNAPWIGAAAGLAPSLIGLMKPKASAAR